MTKLNFKKDGIPFTQVANEVLNDPNLSFKAKGLYAYLYSKPDGWDFAIDRIARDTNEGRKSVNSGLHELEQNGYLLREKQSTGRVIYLLKSQMPKTDIRSLEPNAPLGTLPKGQFAEMGTISNKEGEVIKSRKNKERGEASSPDGKLISEVIHLLETVDPKNKHYYRNTTQREAVTFLLAEYGFEAIRQRITFLPKSNRLPHFPVITSPIQLRDKWIQLDAAVDRLKAERVIKSKVAF